MASKLKKSTDGLISVVLISGIPGSGKGRLAESLHKMLLNENLQSIFYVPNVENSINYNTEMFI
jgi:tRNA uridine 5-carbamoylmethylation protein Kti12